MFALVSVAFWMYFLRKTPDSERSSQAPAAQAPGFSAADASALSAQDHWAMEMDGAAREKTSRKSRASHTHVAPLPE